MSTPAPKTQRGGKPRAGKSDRAPDRSADRRERSPDAADRAADRAANRAPSRAEMREKDVAWLRRVQLEVYRILKLFITDAEMLVKFVDAEAMQVWAQALTHESHSLERNYEELEFLGDAIVKAAFIAWMIRNYPDAKKGQYTSANGYYMSKTFQPVIARRLKLDELVRMSRHAKSNLKVETDLFESFVGALFTIANRGVEPAYGYAVVGVFLDWVMKDVEFDITVEAAHTLVEQFFNRLGWGKPTARNEKAGDKVRIYAVLPDRTRELLAMHGIEGVPAVLGIGEAWTEKVADQIAWSKAQKTLEAYGITKKWSVDLNREKFWARPNLAALREAVEDRAAAYGFEHVDYVEHKKETTKGKGSVVHLIGIYPGGEREIITNRYIRSQTPEDIAEAVDDMLKAFLEFGLEE